MNQGRGAVALLVVGLFRSVTARADYYWDNEETRSFVAGRVGVGASLSGELDVGYGKPFWLWAGFQGWAVATTESAMASAGFKLALPIAELTGGYRVNYAYARAPLPVQPSYSSADLDQHDGDHRYDALDMDLIGFVPLPHLALVPQLGFHRTLGEGEPLYEEEQRVIMTPPWLAYAKLGALFTWGPARRYGLGAFRAVRGWPRTDDQSPRTVVRRALHPARDAADAGDPAGAGPRPAVVLRRHGRDRFAPVRLGFGRKRARFSVERSYRGLAPPALS